MIKKAIVRKPTKNMTFGITSSPELGKPNFMLASHQHQLYIKALRKCLVEVIILDPLDCYPDSCFVEDVAIETGQGCVVITNPGVTSRNGEKEEIIPVIKSHMSNQTIEFITSPGTLEGGDVLKVGDHFFVEHSNRTNQEGIKQFFSILHKSGLSGSVVDVNDSLHLKTNISWLGNDTLLLSNDLSKEPEFKNFKKMIVP
ncbi:MAG TPA: N(G),N(G)-dimethylarginine dimethylaminohydrolase, partial [Candidatus Atribacteria bacterium]|nr:N(G),N(G)-dimethylarginine dimethylaminohydrolase [Candidatus Atribacteria bacterium]